MGPTVGGNVSKLLDRETGGSAVSQEGAVEFSTAGAINGPVLRGSGGQAPLSVQPP